MAVSPEQRRKMIEEAAYYRALSRGFKDGDPVVDWLNAELEIDAKFGLRKHSADETTWFYRHLAEDICCRELEKTLGNTVPLAGPLDERALMLGTHRALR